MHSRRRRAVGRSVRRRTTWARFDASLAVPLVNEVITADLLSVWKGAGGTQQAVTIGRTHIRVVLLGGAPIAGNNIFIGLIRGQTNDVGSNIAGAPNPSVDLNEDWLLWDKLTVDPALALVPGGSQQVTYDLKAMRKLSELEESYNVAISSTSYNAFPANVRVTCSTLLLLP
jgi:hypothetical protein